MKNPVQIKNAIPTVRTSISRAPLRRGFLLIPLALALACFALSPTARAVDPPPDGGYPNFNTAEGTDALFNLRTGFYNTANGFNALFNNTTGSLNTASGFDVMAQNTTGSGNTANGADALFNNTVGEQNTANGYNALNRNTSGGFNTADGTGTLYWNTIGNYNTASGFLALTNNTTGSDNTASGVSALFSNTTGNQNTANGRDALFSNTTGSSNIALGIQAGILTTGSNNIDIGNVGVAGESGIIRVGTTGTQTATFIAGIRETPIAKGVALAVGITADGQLGVRASSARFKEAIRPMNKASEAILSLRPVTFRYKKQLDPKATPQFGLVAEEVAKVDPDLVARDAMGKPFTVRYDEVNAMLLNEFLKEHRKVEEQNDKQQKLEATVELQQREIQALTAALKAQAAQIQTVSDRLEKSGPAPRLVANDQ